MLGAQARSANCQQAIAQEYFVERMNVRSDGSIYTYVLMRDKLFCH